MSQPSRPRPRPSAPSNRRLARPTRNAPTPPTSRLYTGLFVLAVFLAAVFALWRPLAPRTEYLAVSGVATTEAALRTALTATGALPNAEAVRITGAGREFTVASADPEAPLSTDTWRALARSLPGKLAGARATFRSDPPPLVNLGLDLQGGLRVVLRTRTANPSREDVDRVRTIIENRVNQTGVAEPLVQVQGSDRVVVELPGLSQAGQDRALSLIGQTAKLEFRIVNDASASKSDADMTLTDLGPVVLTGEAVRNATAAFDQFGAPQVDMEFTPEGGQRMSEITGGNIGKRLAIVLDQEVKTAPTIQGRFGDRGQITGVGSLEEATDTALVLRSGALPVPVEVIETRAIGPTLGQDAIRSGILASLIGVGTVFALLYLYYGLWFGTVAALGLIFSGVVIFGVFAGLGVVLTLPGIAGLVLTIGAAVDGNVISFERIKEEMRAGKGLRASVRSGFESSFSAIWDSNFANLLAAAALYNYSTGPVRGFAVTLAVGVVVTVFSNVVVSRFLLETLAARRSFTAPQWFVTPKIDFMRLSRYVTLASLGLAAAGALIIAVKGFNYGVDFTSGTSITLRTAANVSAEAVRGAVAGSGVAGVSAGGATIIETRTPGIDGKDFTVRVGELAGANLTRFRAALEELPGGRVTQTETVGPAVGGELRQATIWAVIVALGLTLVYVAFRFDLTFGVALVLAVAHNIAIVLGLVSLLGREFSITTVAAVLTLVGFTLNDAIIVSDRIRENLRLMRGQPYRTIVNASINQTLSRTVMTSLSAMLPLIALLIFGGPVLRDFALVVLTGFVIGTYSSIAIVSPMIVLFKERLAARRRPARARA